MNPRRPSSAARHPLGLLSALSTLLFFSSSAPAVAPADLAAADPAARDAARQALLVSANAASVPTLASQLGSPDTFDDACFLLESLRLPAADAALADGLGRTADARQQAAILNALSRRACAAATEKALSLASAADPAGPAAARYLLSVTRVADWKRLPLSATAHADAFLYATERLPPKARADAAPFCEAILHSALPDQTRLAAFCTILRADPSRTAALLPEGLSNASPVWRGTTARLAAQLPEKTLSRLGPRFVRALPSPGRLALIGALADAKSRAGAPLLRAALADESDADARLAAAAGIGEIGSAEDADALVALLGTADPALANAARMSLIKLADPKVDGRIVRALGKRALGPEAATRLLAVATFRRAPKSGSAITPYLADESPAVRTAAFTALTDLAQPEQLAPLTAAVCKAADAAEKRAAEKALFATSRRHPVPAAAAIRAAFAPADPERRSLLLRALGIAGADEGLPLVLAALADPNADVSDDALRVLADWRSPTAAAPLLSQAKSNAKGSLRILALRGYLRLIPQTADLGARAAQCREATALVARPEEKALLAAAWASVPTQEAVDVLKGWLADPAVKGEALKALRVVALKVPVDLPDVAPGSLLTPLSFLPHRINNHRSEACAVADFNGDGRLDIAAGPFLYLAPDWKPIQIRDVSTTVTDEGKGYADDFCNLALDVNGDGRPDLVSGAWFSKTSFWFENTCGNPGLWPVHVIEQLGNHETGTLVDVDGDGKALEFLPDSQVTVWYEIGRDAKGQPGFVKHVVSEKGCTLGTGCGDVNGDGRPDLIRPNAWFEAPKDIRKGAWIEHPIALGGKDGKVEHTSNIIVTDINKDGLNDLLVSTAHKFGIFWYEQQRAADGAIAWKQHVIDDTWSQAHYLCFADIDGDGNKEIVTGKRFMAHNGGDPDEMGKQCIFYYRFTPGPNPVFRKHVISYDEGLGAGLNTVAVDMDGDGDLDLVTTGKWGGPVLLENRMTEPVSDDARREGLRPPAGTTPPAPAYGENLALASRGAKASSDSELDGSKGCASRLNDGVPCNTAALAATRWHSALTPMPHWAEVKLAHPAKVGRVIARFADPAGFASAFEIQVKQGAAFKTVYATEANGSAQPANVTFSPVETDTVRFVFKKNANPAYPNAAQLGELEVYAP